MTELSPAAKRFEDFHEDNPHVYATLTKLAYAWVDRHHKRRASIALMVEVARWETMMAPTYDANSEFKIANAYRAYYSRLIMWNEPTLVGLFRLNKSAADEWVAFRTAEDDEDKE